MLSSISNNTTYTTFCLNDYVQIYHTSVGCGELYIAFIESFSNNLQFYSYIIRHYTLLHNHAFYMQLLCTLKIEVLIPYK